MDDNELFLLQTMYAEERDPYRAGVLKKAVELGKRESIKNPEDREYAKYLWEELGDVPIDDNDNITCEWRSFCKGTSRFAIWHWFERFFDISVVEEFTNMEEIV